MSVTAVEVEFLSKSKKRGEKSQTNPISFLKLQTWHFSFFFFLTKSTVLQSSRQSRGCCRFNSRSKGCFLREVRQSRRSYSSFILKTESDSLVYSCIFFYLLGLYEKWEPKKFGLYSLYNFITSILENVLFPE